MAAELYCVCRTPYDKTFMIECEGCKDWFHGRCMQIEEATAGNIEKFHCPKCEQTLGPTVWKATRKRKKPNYAELNTGQGVTEMMAEKPVDFAARLRGKQFSEGSCIEKMNGADVRAARLAETGFSRPIFVESTDGLGLVVPPPSFDVAAVARLVGPSQFVNVIDVPTQTTLANQWTLEEWAAYYMTPQTQRDRVLNIISLEFSRTKLSPLVEPPAAARELDWVEQCWPAGDPDRPFIQKYCLMGVAGSFTDFHIDFGGSSVWYHVLRGQKIFYFVEPTDANLKRFEEWSRSKKQSQTFFGDSVSECFQVVVSAGQTLFIPSGWIHAVLTPMDSLVFGGNFVHALSIRMQLEIYDLERRLKIADRFRLPRFETLVWRAAARLPTQNLSAATLAEIPILAATLDKWRSSAAHKSAIPFELESAAVIAALHAIAKKPAPIPRLKIPAVAPSAGLGAPQHTGLPGTQPSAGPAASQPPVKMRINLGPGPQKGVADPPPASPAPASVFSAADFDEAFAERPAKPAPPLQPLRLSLPIRKPDTTAQPPAAAAVAVPSTARPPASDAVSAPPAATHALANAAATPGASAGAKVGNAPSSDSALQRRRSIKAPRRSGDSDFSDYSVEDDSYAEDVLDPDDEVWDPSDDGDDKPRKKKASKPAKSAASKEPKERKPPAGAATAGAGVAGGPRQVERKKKANMTDNLMKRIRALSRKQSY